MEGAVGWIVIGCIICSGSIFGAVNKFSDDRAMVDLAKYELQARELDIREKEINCVK